jgi:hypothetical protein
MKIILKFDSMIFFFVEDLINLMINCYVDVLFIISIKNDFSRFFLIQITDKTR